MYVFCTGCCGTSYIPSNTVSISVTERFSVANSINYSLSGTFLLWGSATCALKSLFSYASLYFLPPFIYFCPLSSSLFIHFLTSASSCLTALFVGSFGLPHISVCSALALCVSLPQLGFCAFRLCYFRRFQTGSLYLSSPLPLSLSVCSS